MNQGEPLSPAAFKDAYRKKGWKSKELAERWGLSYAWMSKIANDPARRQYWDDAVIGLPETEKLKPTGKKA